MSTPLEKQRLAALHAALIALPLSIVSCRFNDDSVGHTSGVSVDPSNLQSSAQATIDGWDWTQGGQDSYVNLTYRTLANDRITTGIVDLDKLHRAVASVLVDEINLLRDWIMSLKAAVAAATSLANLQTRVAALADMPDRTLAQAKTAITTKVNSGTVD